MSYPLSYNVSKMLGLLAALLMAALGLHKMGTIGDLGFSQTVWDCLTVISAALAMSGFALPNLLESPTKRDVALLEAAPRLGLVRRDALNLKTGFMSGFKGFPVGENTNGVALNLAAGGGYDAHAAAQSALRTATFQPTRPAQYPLDAEDAPKKPAAAFDGGC